MSVCSLGEVPQFSDETEVGFEKGDFSAENLKISETVRYTAKVTA